MKIGYAALIAAVAFSFAACLLDEDKPEPRSLEIAGWAGSIGTLDVFLSTDMDLKTIVAYGRPKVEEGDTTVTVQLYDKNVKDADLTSIATSGLGGLRWRGSGDYYVFIKDEKSVMYVFGTGDAPLIGDALKVIPALLTISGSKTTIQYSRFKLWNEKSE
jgi:hypothetical protein